MATSFELPELKETHDVRAQRIARVYAEALYAAAERRGQAAQVVEEVESLVTDAFRDRRLEVFFSSAAVGRDVRAAALNKVFASRASETFNAFLQVLNSHERLELIRPIARALRELADERSRRVRVHVVTATPLADDQKATLTADLRERLKLEPTLVASVDPAILGGLKIRVGDVQFDGTVRTRIENLKNQILARSSHEIQSRRDRFRTAD